MSYEQRTIEAFFQEYGVNDADTKAKLLPLLTPIIYNYNQHVIEIEKETDEYKKKQIIRGLDEIGEKIKKIMTSKQDVAVGPSYEV
ncbi:MAG: hypothetical protein WC477_01470 [Patescibacteria group bacterium]